MIAYISIGNSDDKLSQAEWSQFCTVLEDVIRDFATHIHGVWFSHSASQYQNACICADFDDNVVGTGEHVEMLERALITLTKEYRQDSIAMAIVKKTVFIGES